MSKCGTRTAGIYMLFCTKNPEVCARVKLTYIGMCGEGESSSFTHRVGSHLGTATQNSQANTMKTMGRHFRLPGREPYRDLVMPPIEIVSPRDPFLLRTRENYNIWKFQTEKRMGILDIEHGLTLNLDAGQQ